VDPDPAAADRADARALRRLRAVGRSPAGGAGPDPVDGIAMQSETKERIAVQPADRKVLRSEELFGTAREITIRHNGQEYRLQVTRNGKLILIK
jgi:hemin uptake protein HemP